MTHHIRAIASILATVVTLSCESESVPPPDHLGCGPRVAEEETGLRVAVLSHFIAKVASEASARHRVVSLFIAAEERFQPDYVPFFFDPPDEVMARFASHTPTVKPLSARVGSMPLNDPPSRALPIVLATGNICRGGATAVVRASLAYQFGEVRSYDVSLERRQDLWVVASERPSDD